MLWCHVRILQKKGGFLARGGNGGFLARKRCKCFVILVYVTSQHVVMLRKNSPKKKKWELSMHYTWNASRALTFFCLENSYKVRALDVLHVECLVRLLCCRACCRKRANDSVILGRLPMSACCSKFHVQYIEGGFFFLVWRILSQKEVQMFCDISLKFCDNSQRILTRTFWYQKNVKNSQSLSQKQKFYLTYRMRILYIRYRILILYISKRILWW